MPMLTRACCRQRGALGALLVAGAWGGVRAAPAVGAEKVAGKLDQETSVRMISGFSENPNDTALYGTNTESNEAVLMRESLIYHRGRDFRLEANVYNLIIGSSDKTSASQYILNGTDETNRSSRLERHWHSSQSLDGYLTVDRLNLKTNVAGTEVTVGRFPINLSTTAIFTPNDFFAPFRPYDYYREYKPGVDGVRLDHPLGLQGQISLIGVAGYDNNHLSVLGHADDYAGSGRYSAAAASQVIRIAQTVHGFEGALLGGKLGNYNMLGFNLQGGVGPLGLRAEGHQRNSRIGPQKHTEAVFGFDYRPRPKLLLQVEQYFNGAGYPSVADYANIATDPEPPTPFIARNYTGVGAVYELTPLVSLKTLFIANEDDHSLLADLNLVYAISENSELVVSLLSPHGRGPLGQTANSEFGSYPRILSVQTGIYF